MSKESKQLSISCEQLKAIHFGYGPLLIIAGPGSGKTFVIIQRLHYLIEQLHVKPSRILVLTFSRAAAREMEERYGASEICFGTFHSVFYSLLQRAYGSRASRYLTADKDAVKYEEMLLLTEELLTERSDILDEVRRMYSWILIDEFQDIDPLQYRIVRMIGGEHPNLTVVGDDDQSIYGFRGSDPGIMLHFPEDYPDTGIVQLDINFRSTPEIVSLSQNLIRHNRNRFSKTVRSLRPSGEKVRLLNFSDVSKEYATVVNEIHDLVSAGVRPDQIAVLYRTNMQNWNLGNLLCEAHCEEVFVSTFHGAKGLEFDRVFIIDANETVSPHIRSMDEEEERRLFYVAMTRARNALTICFVRRKRERSIPESRFIKELYS